MPRIYKRLLDNNNNNATTQSCTERKQSTQKNLALTLLDCASGALKVQTREKSQRPNGKKAKEQLGTGETNQVDAKS